MEQVERHGPSLRPSSANWRAFSLHVPPFSRATMTKQHLSPRRMPSVVLVLIDLLNNGSLEARTSMAHHWLPLLGSCRRASAVQLSCSCFSTNPARILSGASARVLPPCTFNRRRTDVAEPKLRGGNVSSSSDNPYTWNSFCSHLDEQNTSSGAMSNF